MAEFIPEFIVDTSVWVDFFRGRLPKPILDYLSEGLELGAAAVTDIVRNEILVGARHSKDFLELKKLLSPLPCFRISDDDLPRFDEFAWRLSQKGLLGKYTDAAIAFVCHQRKVPLLSFDGYFYRLARKGILSVLPVPHAEG